MYPNVGTGSADGSEEPNTTTGRDSVSFSPTSVAIGEGPTTKVLSHFESIFQAGLR